MAEYTHLHSHTAFSLLDGAMSPEQYVDAVASHGMTACACTDHGYLYALPDFQRACEKKGIKPIMGIEMYLVDDVKRVKEEKDSRRFHQLVIAKNEQGLKNLYKLAALSTTEGYFYYRPLIDFESLKRFREGLIVTSGCVMSVIPQTLLDGTLTKNERLEKAIELARWFKDVFGEDFYLEAHRHGFEPEDVVAAALPEIAKRVGVKIITANDCHYVEPTDYRFQDALTCISMQKKVNDPEREKYAHENLYVKSPGEMADLFPEFPEAPENTMLLAEKVDAKLTLGNQQYHFPAFPIPETETPAAYLRQLVRDRFHSRFQNLERGSARWKEVTERVKTELEMIEQMGFPNYFLIVQDIVNGAKQRGVTVGPGRGSAAGSIVSYILGITDLDPTRFGLLFERFLNPDRVSMPDIDLDFADDRRQDVFDYIYETYGRDRVAQIITFSGLKAKSGIKDFGRVLGMEPSETLALSKKIPDSPKEMAKTLEKLAEGYPALAKLKAQNPDLYQWTSKAHNYPRHTGIHAAAVVITPGKLTNYLPVEEDRKKGTFITQFAGEHLDDLGLLKMDILGLKTLTVIRRTREIVARKGITITDEELCAYDDPKVYEAFARGDTDGVFQFESDGMKQWLRKLKPTELDDLIAMNALYRPGPMDLIPSYIKRKHGEEAVIYPHDLLEPVLKSTYGIPVYQEQVMQMAQVVAGYTLAEADLLRRAMGKKLKEKMDIEKERFLKGAQKKGLTLGEAAPIFAMMEKFAGYGFNKSHSAAYSDIAYRTMYLKVHHPVAFFAASIEAEDFAKRESLIRNAQRFGVKFLPPDVNCSGIGFTVEDTGGNMAIRYGLGAVKDVGQEAETIIEERKNRGDYRGYRDFIDRLIPNAKAAKALILAGALDDLGGKGKSFTEESLNRATMYSNVDALLKHRRKVRDYEEGKRKSEPEPPEIVHHDPWQRKMMLFQEREYVGTFVSGHPLDPYRELIESLLHRPDIYKPGFDGKDHYRLFPGVITGMTKRRTYKGNPMWFVKFDDGREERELACFAETMKRFGAFLQQEADVLIIGKEGSGAYKGRFNIEAALPLSRVLEEWVQVVSVETDDVDAVLDRALKAEGEQAEVWVKSGDGTNLLPVRVQLSRDFASDLRAVGTVSMY